MDDSLFFFLSWKKYSGFYLPEQEKYYFQQPFVKIETDLNVCGQKRSKRQSSVMICGSFDTIHRGFFYTHVERDTHMHAESMYIWIIGWHKHASLPNNMETAGENCGITASLMSHYIN